MKRSLFVAGIITSLITLSILACNSDSAPSKNTEGMNLNSAAISEDSLIKKGEYLVNIMGCGDCHSPKIMGKFGPEPDGERLLSGHPSNLPFPKVDTADLKSFVLFNPITTAAAGPWGVSFAANLTSDESGIGNWTEEQFFTAIRKGKSKGLENGRPILPPMPWATLAANVKDEDLKAIFAYLKSTKPVHNVVPAPIDFRAGK